MKGRIMMFVAAVTSTSLLIAGPSLAAVPADPPTNITVSSKSGTGTASISWTPVSGVTGYKVRAMIGTVTIKTATVVGENSKSYTFTGLEYKVPYTLGVKAGNVSGYALTYTDASTTVIPVAAPPSPPDKPLVSVERDGFIETNWEAPANTGGSPIASYSVQLWKKGVKSGDPKLPSSTTTTFDTKGDTTTQFTVTVQAVNSEGIPSPESEPSQSIAAEKQTTSAAITPEDNSVPSGGPGGNSGLGEAPKDSGKDTQTPLKSENSSSPVAIPLAKPVVSYSKSVYVTTRTSTKTLLSLSKLATPKGSKTSYTLSKSSKKYCTLKGTVVTAIKSGTCSVTVMVKQKSGKKSSKTVKLVVRAKR